MDLHTRLILHKLDELLNRTRVLMATVADVNAALAAQKTVLDQAVAAIVASHTAPTAAELDAVVATVQANTAEVQAALTPPAPAPAPAA